MNNSIEDKCNHIIKYILELYDKNGNFLIVGISGPQGCGKSTICKSVTQKLNKEYQITTLALSLDDFYLPVDSDFYKTAGDSFLYAGRVNPGTHDIDLLDSLLRALKTEPIGASRNSLQIPMFDKYANKGQGQRIIKALEVVPQIILLEGWMLGFASIANGQTHWDNYQQLDLSKLHPECTFERIQFMNQQLAKYQVIWEMVDVWITFELVNVNEKIIQQWRWEAELKHIIESKSINGRKKAIYELVHRCMPAYMLYRVPSKPQMQRITLNKSREIIAIKSY